MATSILGVSLTLCPSTEVARKVVAAYFAVRRDVFVAFQNTRVFHG